jgi:hypothetical protein
MSNQTMTELIQELMVSYDSSIDTSSGSSFHTTVIIPLLKRIGDDPLGADVEELIAAHLEENIEGIEAGEGSGVRDLIARPLTVGMEPWKRELQGLKTAASLDNHASLTRDEVNALLANFFTELKEGSKSTVTVRMYFGSAQTVVVTPLTGFSTGSSLNFFPTATQTITSTSMSFNQEGSYYYMDVACEGEAAGDEYNVDTGSINSVSGIAGVVKVTNKSKATSGAADETKLEGITRAKESITIRNLSVLRGCKTVLQGEYSNIDAIEVVGMGDELMLRDLITGPVSISGIPGGFVGADPAVIGSGQQVHIGGKTDIWLFTTAPTEETLDIENITDHGFRIYAGKYGYTQAGSGTTTFFFDEFGRFSDRGISSGDFLKLGEDEILITGATNTRLTLTSAISEGLSSQVYEVVGYENQSVHQDGEVFKIFVPLHNLVALDSAGSAVLDDDGDPVLAVPGDVDLSAYVDPSGAYVKLTENISDTNLALPMVRVKSVEFLSSFDQTETGDFVPLADILMVRTEGAFAGGSASPAAPATGDLRFYFKDPVNFFVTSGFRASPDQIYEYSVDTIPAPNADIVIDTDGSGGWTATLSGDRTGTNFNIGFRVFDGSHYWTILSLPVYDSGAGETTFAVREEPTSPPFTISIGSYSIHPGSLEGSMNLDADTGLYYLEVEATCTTDGTAGNIPDGTTMEITSSEDTHWAEGYYALARTDVSYSTKELSVLGLSRYVNDDKDLRDVSVSYYIRVTYDYAQGYQDVQDYVEDVDNRPVGEDILVRHMLPSLVVMSLTTDMDADDVEETVVDFLIALDPTKDFEISDLVEELYGAGATYVQMPLQCSVLKCGRDRRWTATHVQDTHTTSRINHYLADTDSITGSES